MNENLVYTAGFFFYRVIPQNKYIVAYTRDKIVNNPNIIHLL